MARQERNSVAKVTYGPCADTRWRHLRSSRVWRVTYESTQARMWGRQHVMRAVTTQLSAHCCGVSAIPGSEITVRRRQHGDRVSTHFGGVQNCGRGALCPRCARQASGVNQQMLAAVARRGMLDGMQLVLGLFTLPHTPSDSCSAVLDALFAALRRWGQSRTKRAIWETYGVSGGYRSVEVTYGTHGWHPHVHYALLVPRDVDLERLERDMFGSWRDAVVATWGREPVQAANGLSVARDDAAVIAYFDGQGERLDFHGRRAAAIARERASLEMTARLTKRGHRSKERWSVSQWEILDLLAERSADGDAPTPVFLELLRLWQEWEAASKNRRMYAWLGKKPQIEVEDVGETEQDFTAPGDDEEVVEVSAPVARETWDGIHRAGAIQVFLHALACPRLHSRLVRALCADWLVRTGSHVDVGESVADVLVLALRDYCSRGGKYYKQWMEDEIRIHVL